MIKYRVLLDKIEAHEVLRETEKQVVLPALGRGWGSEQRENKRSDWHSWHDTWEEAHAHLVDKVQCQVDALRGDLERAKGRLGQVKGMKPPPTQPPA